ncbi:MAG TPA: Calx-beta domain-containing protein [Verrucomicrobiae bacterium]|jgi:hypothetical protein|nr:Calx-beta domain-containing protein [Verrucomicrobiae bacterium]
MSVLSPLFLPLIPVILLNALSANISAQTFHTLDYDTPAYVDLELSEITAPSSERTIPINLYRTGDFRQSTTIEFATVEGTAEEGRDYKGTGGTITFKPGEGYKTLFIEILTNQFEDEKAFQVKLTASSTSTVLLRDTVEVTLKPVPKPFSPVTLSISRDADGTIRLSWEGNSSYVLERSSDPASTDWETIPCSPTVTQGHCEVTQSPDGSFHAYRLRGP